MMAITTKTAPIPITVVRANPKPSPSFPVKPVKITRK